MHHELYESTWATVGAFKEPPFVVTFLREPMSWAASAIMHYYGVVVHYYYDCRRGSSALLPYGVGTTGPMRLSTCNAPKAAFPPRKPTTFYPTKT